MPASPKRAAGEGSLYLVDASPYIFRAFYSLPSSIKTPEGRPINAARGFADFLAKLLREESPTHVLVAFDGSLTTSFRNEIYPPYKSSRDLPDEDLVAQLEACYDFAEAFGCYHCIDDRYEADDLISTARHVFDADFSSFVVVTADKDLAQLVDERTSFYDFGKGRRMGISEVVEKFGVRPDQIADFLGLAGDSVDDIPGVKGVGPKTATALLNAFDSLEEIYDGLDRVKDVEVRGAKTLAAKLEQHRDMAFLSRELATCSVEASLKSGAEGLTRDGLVWSGERRAELDALSVRLGYRADRYQFS